MNRKRPSALVAFAVVACSDCHTAWSVELRHRTSRCPRCPALVDLRKRRRLWQGDDAQDARQAAAAIQAALAQGIPLGDLEQAQQATLLAPPATRHDSPIDAAAAKGRSVTNQSDRAEEVARWLTRLLGDPTEEDHLAALAKAGIAAERAERELVRMLACDVLYEPRPGVYRCLET
jgi:hypothetical protein